MKETSLKATPITLDGYDNLGDLHRVLTDAGYNEDAIANCVGGGKGQIAWPPDLTAALMRTEEETPFNTLVRLFMLGRSVPGDAVRRALAPVDPDDLCRMGLLKADPDGLRSEVALMAFDRFILARDIWPEFTGGGCPPNYVLGVGPASLAVANMTVRTPVETALDIGTGTGFLALLAAGHANRVTATDTNQRALNLAAFSARLNGITNIDFRRGSLFDPVGENKFDLIMSNPPFVISPGCDYEYRDNSLGGDAFAQQLLQNAPARLTEGAFCTVLFNWHHRDADDWGERPGQWLRDNGCDTWLLCSKSEDPLSYAIGWLQRDNLADPGQYRKTLEDWLAYYQSAGVGRISLGAAILRKRSNGANWLHMEKAPSEQALGSCSDQILRMFTARNLLESLEDNGELLDRSFVLTDEHELVHELVAKNGGWTVRQATLKQTRGFQYTGNVDQLVTRIIAGCDGRSSLGSLATGLAGEMKVAPDKLIPSCLRVVRMLLETGFLIPSSHR